MFCENNLEIFKIAFFSLKQFHVKKEMHFNPNPKELRRADRHTKRKEKIERKESQWTFNISSYCSNILFEN